MSQIHDILCCSSSHNTSLVTMLPHYNIIHCHNTNNVTTQSISQQKDFDGHHFGWVIKQMSVQLNSFKLLDACQIYSTPFLSNLNFAGLKSLMEHKCSLELHMHCSILFGKTQIKGWKMYLSLLGQSVSFCMIFICNQFV